MRSQVKTDQVSQAFERALQRAWRRLVPSGTGVLLAVSGGADSLALLFASARVAGRVGLKFEVATVDHGLRAEAAAEAEVVGQLAQTLGLTHHTLRLNPAGRSENLESWARHERYTALAQTMLLRGLTIVATAHTANDQAETLMMRLTRGTALAGAAAIHELRDDGVVRPMLFATRAEVEAYVTARSLPIAHDPMNDDPSFLRVRMRQAVLPAIVSAAGAQAIGALARFSTLAAEDEAYLSAEASIALQRIISVDASIERISLLALEAPIARRVIAKWLSALGIELDGELVAEVLRAASRASVTPLPGDRLLDASDGRLSVRPAPERRNSPNFILKSRA